MMKMKNFNKIVIIIMMLFLLIGVAGCSKTEETIPNQFQGIKISEYFLINEESEQLAGDLQFYLIWVQHYYSHSDKKSFKSFKLDELEYCDTQIKNIESHRNDKKTISEEAIVKTTLVGYYLKIQYLLAEKELLEAVGNKESEEWFLKLGSELDKICQEMINGIEP